MTFWALLKDGRGLLSRVVERFKEVTSEKVYLTAYCPKSETVITSTFVCKMSPVKQHWKSVLPHSPQSTPSHDLPGSPCIPLPTDLHKQPLSQFLYPVLLWLSSLLLPQTVLEDSLAPIL